MSPNVQNKKIAIINYGLGNIFSITQALKRFHVSVVDASKPEDLVGVDGIILPGVGAFGVAMENLKRIHMDTEIRRLAATGIPLFGICLGLQLLMTESEEFGRHEGLNLIPGRVVKFPESCHGKLLRVPTIGWNSCSQGPENSWASSPFSDLKPGVEFYFVHSFYVVPEDANSVLSYTNYEGISYASAIKKGNIFATQFHPEKSGENGLLLIKTWLESIGESR